MSVDERITTILVDTCAFRDANSDFIGISSMLLPSFFSVIKEKDILLLTHPILEREIEKHIEDSGIYKDYQSLVSHINKCKDVLRYANCCDEELFSKIADYNIKNQTVRAYKKYYKNAVKLDYPNPELIFELYFLSKPPFASTGKKKCEFPDAFVIEATKQYINEHPNDVLLVVSKDNDWVKSFWGVDNVIMCESIVEAIKKINSIESILSEDMLIKIFKGAYTEILSEAQRCAELEDYYLDDYELYEELEIDSVKVVKVEDSFVPLKISRDMILIKTIANVRVAGYGEIFDEDRSVWDNEDKEYFIIEYSDIDFDDGEAQIECEISIKFDFDNLEETARVDRFKFNNRGYIYVSCVNAEITPIDEDEMALRCLREDKGYSRRG